MEQDNTENDPKTFKQVEHISRANPFPKRYILAGLIFLGFCVLYGLRVNLNIAIGVMCNNSSRTVNGFKVVKQPEFNWDSKLQGIVLGSFYYGYLVLQIPGGWLAYKLGGTRIFGIAIVIASVLTLLTPIAARTNVNLLIALRVVEGIVLGVLFPCNHAIWAKWAPPTERSRLFTITAAGCPVGTIITMPISGLLSKYGFDGGWASVFYVFGLIGVLWYLVWFMCVHPTPQEHPTISLDELTYIETSIAESPSHKAEQVPWLKILTSLPVWACAVANFCADWGMYTILICIPKYFVEVLDFDIAKAGFAAATPYILKAIIGPTGGIIADKMIIKNISIRNVRRYIYTFGCTVAATFIVAMGYSTNATMAILLLSIGVGITGLNATGYAVNILDIAPQFAGPIMGMSNVFGSIPGFVSPYIVGIVAKNKTAQEWQIIFWITAFAYLVGIVFFWFSVSGDVQPWAKSSQKTETSTNVVNEQPESHHHKHHQTKKQPSGSSE